jgi:hypothetical protein
MEQKYFSGELARVFAGQRHGSIRILRKIDRNQDLLDLHSSPLHENIRHAFGQMPKP